MITQETKPVKIWGEFNLAILKVNLNPLMKESKLFNRTQTTNILLLPTSRNLLTRPCANSETTDSFFLGFSSKYKHTRLCFFKFLWQQLNDHQVLKKISFLIVLSLCKGKLLTNLTRDLHKQQYEQHQNVVRVCLIYLGQKYKTLNILNKLGLSWNSTENAFCPNFD